MGSEFASSLRWRGRRVAGTLNDWVTGGAPDAVQSPHQPSPATEGAITLPPCDRDDAINHLATPLYFFRGAPLAGAASGGIQPSGRRASSPKKNSSICSRRMRRVSGSAGLSP